MPALFSSWSLAASFIRSQICCYFCVFMVVKSLLMNNALFDLMFYFVWGFTRFRLKSRKARPRRPGRVGWLEFFCKWSKRTSWVSQTDWERWWNSEIFEAGMFFNLCRFFTNYLFSIIIVVSSGWISTTYFFSISGCFSLLAVFMRYYRPPLIDYIRPCSLNSFKLNPSRFGRRRSPSKARLTPVLNSY